MAEMQNLSKFNDGVRYILTCIDVFSNIGYAVAVKDKCGQTFSDAFEKKFRTEDPLYAAD